MARIALILVLLVALLAGPAAAATRVSWSTRAPDYLPPFWNSYQRIISVSGDSGVSHDIVVKPSGARQFNGFPQVVDVYDYGDTVVDGSGTPCHIYSTHHAGCVVSGGPVASSNPYSYPSYAEIDISTGDGNDSVTINDPLNPIATLLYTGDGNDHVTLGNVWTWYYKGGGLGLGAGDDEADLGPSPVTAAPWANLGGLSPSLGGLLLFAGSGDDTVNSLNGSQDAITCDDGTDTLLADPTDRNSFDGGYGPPIANDCESRTPPGVSP
jgi:hypothetical protein